MQEEVEQRIVSLMISCGKLGEQEFRKAVAKLLEQLKNGHQKHQYSKANPHGKMTVKQLAAKDKGLQSIEVTDQNIGSFNRIARKYGGQRPRPCRRRCRCLRHGEAANHLRQAGMQQ